MYLANYYGNKLFYADTAIVDGKSNATFKDPKGYKAGVYAVVVPGPKYFELIVIGPGMYIPNSSWNMLSGSTAKETTGKLPGWPRM